MKRVLVIGGGSIGQAIRTSVVEDVVVNIFDNDKAKATVSTIEEGLNSADIVFVCVPSQALSMVVSKLVEAKTLAPIVLLTKGLDEETGDFPYELFQKAGLENVAILYGPMIAHKLSEKKHSFGMLASSNQEIYQQLKEIFSNCLHIEYTSDIHSIAILGIIKNIYSLGAGMLQGLDVGENVMGMYTVRVLQEMKSILTQLKGNVMQAEHVSGLGDFIATSTSEYSKNRATGDNLVNGGAIPSTSEGMASLQLFCKKMSVCPPLLDTLNAIAQKTKTPEALLETLISYE
ncbi:MAG: hypothetical protein WA051_00135 [Minisyncoccia bacterium]